MTDLDTSYGDDEDHLEDADEIMMNAPPPSAPGLEQRRKQLAADEAVYDANNDGVIDSQERADQIEVRKAWNEFDQDKNGYIDATEFRDLLETLAGGEDEVTEKFIVNALAALDTSKDGKIQQREFENWWLNKRPDGGLNGDPTLQDKLRQLAKKGRKHFNVDIHRAAWDGDIEVVEHLINAAGDGARAQREVEFAQEDEDEDEEDAWGRAGNTVEMSLENRERELRLAAAAGREALVNSIDKSEYGGNYTPLHYAAYKGHLDLCVRLIELKANIRARTTAGCTPIFLASQQGHIEVVRLLLESEYTAYQAEPSKPRASWYADKERGMGAFEVAGSEAIQNLFRDPRYALERPAAPKDVYVQPCLTQHVSQGTLDPSQGGEEPASARLYVGWVMQQDKFRLEWDDSGEVSSVHLQAPRGLPITGYAVRIKQGRSTGRARLIPVGGEGHFGFSRMQACYGKEPGHYPVRPAKVLRDIQVGQPVSVQVAAVNAIGLGEWSPLSSATTVLPPPTKPELVHEVSGSSATSIAVGWTPSDDPEEKICIEVQRLGFRDPVEELREQAAGSKQPDRRRQRDAKFQAMLLATKLKNQPDKVDKKFRVAKKGINRSAGRVTVHGLQPSSRYRVRVQARNAWFRSEYSESKYDEYRTESANAKVGTVGRTTLTGTLGDMSNRMPRRSRGRGSQKQEERNSQVQERKLSSQISGERGGSRFSVQHRDDSDTITAATEI